MAGSLLALLVLAHRLVQPNVRNRTPNEVMTPTPGGESETTRDFKHLWANRSVMAVPRRCSSMQHLKSAKFARD
jgi:hypothetical protein